MAEPNVLLRKKAHDEGYIVLAEWDRGTSSEFVTWYEDAEGNYYCGRYFSGTSAGMKCAQADFEKRC